MNHWIDIHVHFGRILHNLPPLSIDDLVARIDREGITRACVMAVENPEEVDYYTTTTQVLEACSRYPDRLIPFCSVDPRHRYPETFDPAPLIAEYHQQGCRGFGEVLAGVPIDHPGLQQIYAVCGEYGLPVLFHADHLICYDEPGSPRLEKMLQKFKKTIFIGHGTRFWAEISQGADLRRIPLSQYPQGKIIPTGPIDRLLSNYPNLYGDLSAGSGYTALTRDPEFGLCFLERLSHKLLFGTDLLRPDQPLPIVEFLRTCPISEEARSRICWENAARLLMLNGS
ncbi:MAG TPA: amidohydrolase family protein [Anaerolineaceae bacterium]